MNKLNIVVVVYNTFPKKKRKKVLKFWLVGKSVCIPFEDTH